MSPTKQKLTREEKQREKELQAQREKRSREAEKAKREQQKEEAKRLKEQRKDPQFRAQQKAEMKDLRAKRKELRKDLRSRGMKRRSDFEFFARELGFSYPEHTGRAAVAGALAKGSAVGKLAMSAVTLPALLGGACTVLAATFLVAYVTEEKGHFTINLTADMMREGFCLSETADFEKSMTRLFATEITNSNATSIYEMNRNIHEVDGSHNGPGYMAYTFYIRNEGEMATDYGYTVNILSETLNTGAAAWVMFFEDDHQIIYARPQPNGEPEMLLGYPSAPFIETAYDPENQYFTQQGEVGIVTTPFVDETTALQGYVEDFQPGESKKYTVVVWLEGDDPDCNNSILGGHVGFNIQFDRLGEEETGYFKGLFREEYDKTFHGQNPEDPDYEPGDQNAHKPEEGQT